MRKLYKFASILVLLTASLSLGFISGCGSPSYDTYCSWVDSATAKFVNVDLALPSNFNNPIIEMRFPSYSFGQTLEFIANDGHYYCDGCVFRLTSTAVRQCTTGTSSSYVSATQDNYSSIFIANNPDEIEGVKMVSNTFIPLYSYKFQLEFFIKGVTNNETGETGTLVWNKVWSDANSSDIAILSQAPLCWQFWLSPYNDYMYATFKTTANYLCRRVYVHDRYENI